MPILLLINLINQGDIGFAYPFVRLHQPSAFYGVNSWELSNDLKDTVGLNEGLYGFALVKENRKLKLTGIILLAHANMDRASGTGLKNFDGFASLKDKLELVY